MASQTISLNRGDSPNLGFRLQGGIDFAQPLVIQKVNSGSPADRAGLKSGDAVIKINNTDVYNLRHKEAQDVIIKAGSAFSITIQRGGSTWRPQVTPTGNLHSASPNSPVTRTSLAAKPQQSIDAIGTGHNVAAKPFLNGAVNGGPKLVNKQYNSPIGIYSEQSIAETITKQSEVLSTGAVGVNFKKNEKNYDATKSAVYSMLQEAEKEPNYSEPEPDTGIVSAPLGSGFGTLKHVEAPVNKPAPPTPQLPPGQNICADCERLIVGVFVRIKDKNLHVECFKCSTCGASLKNVGYYNINNKLYCDVHAKLAAKANPPGPNLVPVTIPPGGKAPASAISSALATHSLPSPGPISPKLGAGPISPSQNITAAPFQPEGDSPPKLYGLTSAKLLNSIIKAAAKKNNAKHEPALLKSDTFNQQNKIDQNNLNNQFDQIHNDHNDQIDYVTRLNTENNINNTSVYPVKLPVLPKNYTNTPKPFSSVAAPLSPNSYSRPLPKTPYQAPPAPAPVLPASPIIAPAAPAFAPKPAGGSSAKEKVEIVENIVWPPVQEDITDLPTASPLYFPPSTHVHVKVRHLSDRPQTPYEKNSEKSESRSTTPATAHSTTEKTESDSDYQDLEDYTNFLKNMEPKMSVCSSEVYNINGRRSTLECVETIAEHLQTAMLVDHVMKKRPKSPPPLNQPILKPPAPPAHKEEGPIKPVCPLKCQQSCCNDCPECPMKKPAELRRLSELERFEEMKSKIQNNVPQGWESQMVSALRTTPDKPFCVSPEFAAIPAKTSKGLLASAMTIAPKEPFCPVHPIIPVFNTEPVPLPEETVPYLPPERPLLPELMHQAKEVKKEIEKPASPFVQALKTTPERPYSPIGHAPTPIRPRKPSDPFLKGLPKPTEKLSMLSALTTASDRTYSPMTVQCEFARDANQQKEQEQEKKKEEEKRKFSIKQPIPQPFIATMVETFEGNPQGGTPQQEFNPISVELQGMAEYHADYEEVKSELNTQINYQQKRAQEMQKEVQQMQAQVKVQQQVYQQQEVQERTQEEVQHEHVCCLHRKQAEQIARQNEEVIIKKPLTLAESLKKSEYIPNYQSALEYDQEIQLPHHKDIKKLLKPHEQSKIIPNPRPLLAADPHHAMATPPPKITAPLTVVSDYKPNTSFQTVNDNFEPPSSAMNQRLGQPSPSRINKSPSAIPYYQQNLVATQFLAPEINVFDPSSPAVSRSPSPCPGAKPERPSSPFRKPQVRPKSPAAGPPPNPLKQHKDHVHFKEDFKTENAKDKITSYIPHHQERFHEIQRREGDHYDHSREVEFNQSRGQINKPGYQEQTYQGQARQAEAMQSHQVSSQGKMQVSRSEQLRSEQIAQLNKSQAQSVQMSADGRTQVQRKRTVVEEFEQSHKENTIEIQKSYPVKVNQSAPLAREEQQALKGLHVTNPGQIASPFLTQPISGPPPMPKNPIPPAPKAPEPPKPVYKPVQCPVPSKVPVPPVPPLSSDVLPSSAVNPSQSDDPAGRQAGGNVFAPKRGRGVLNVGGLGARIAQCAACHSQIRGPFITALGKIWCPEHFVCATAQCRRPLQDIGFVEEQGQLHCEYCFEQYLAPNCAKCGSKVKGDCLKAIQKNFHPECFSCAHCGKLFGNNPFFLEDGLPYCEADWNEMFTTKCFACGFPVEAGDRWVEALNNNYHTQCFNCTSCKKNLEGQSFYAKGGRPFCKNHAR